MSGARRAGYKAKGKFGSGRKFVRSRVPWGYGARRVGNSTRAMALGIPRSRVSRSLKEERYIDNIPVNGSSVSTTWTSTPLVAAPVVGAAVGNRLGNHIQIKAIEVWVTGVGVPDSTVDVFNAMRCFFGVFKAPRASGAPAASGLNGVMDNTTIASPYSPMSVEFKDNYIYKKNLEFQVCSYNTTAAQGTSAGVDQAGTRQFHFKIRFPGAGLVAKFIANTGASADWEEGLPFVVYGSDSGAISHPTLTIRTRMYFDA